MTTKPERHVDHALSLAQRGWPVFPCQPGGKEPATRHGFRDATTHPKLIRLWWKHMPDANVAVATGTPGPDVLDVDRHGAAGNGFAAFKQLKRAGLLGGCGSIVATPGGGLHAYFTGSDQRCRRLSRLHLLDDLAAAAAKTGLPGQEIARTIASASRSAQPPVDRQPEREGA